MDERAFGIGCMQFEASYKDFGEWQQTVQRVLEAIPSVRDVELDFPDGKDIPQVSRVGSIYFSPHPTSGILRFKVSIPRRIHREVMPFVTGEHSEEFTVIFCYWRYFPVTFVLEGTDATGANSTSVAIVREFLEREIKRLGADAKGVTLACLGPSPFHADFRLKPSTEAIEEDSGVSIAKSGNPSPTVTISYDPNRVKTSAEAFGQFSALTMEQFSYFYYQAALRKERLEKAMEVSDLTAKLIEMHQSSGLRGWVLRAIRAGRLAREVSLFAISYEFDGARDQQSTKRELDSLYERSSISLFRPWIESEIEEDFIAEIKASRETADLLEPRRLREANLLLVIVVAILSAFLGATAKVMMG